MYELVQISDHDYIVECPAKVGIVKITENDVVLIDSGSDKDTAKKILRIVEGHNWNVKSVYNTHSHADHIGGNKYLQEKTGCKVYSYKLENVYTNNPYLEPIGLYGGVPFKNIQNKFLMAQPSNSISLSLNDLPSGMKLIELPGHSFDMVGFITADKTAFIADSVSSVDTLKKYGISYLWNYKEAICTLDYLKTLDAERFVPSHASVVDNISELADYNRRAIVSLVERITDMCTVPVTFEKLLKMLFDAYEMQMTAQQYVLIGSTLRSYLSVMYEQGILKFDFCDNEMIWEKSI